jgi:hypothetical protein
MKHNEGSESVIDNKLYNEFMDEIFKGVFTIESEQTLNSDGFEAAKESSNCQDENRVVFTLLNDLFLIWLAKHEQFLRAIFYKKGYR